MKKHTNPHNHARLAQPEDIDFNERLIDQADRRRDELKQERYDAWLDAQDNEAERLRDERAERNLD
jgi:hypothetical protein